MFVGRRLIAATCMLTFAGGLTATTVPAHAATATTTTATAAGVTADQLATVQTLLGDGTLSAAAQSAAPLAESEWSTDADAVIDGSQYTCGTTELRDWLVTQQGPADLMTELSTYHVFDFAQYYAMYYETNETPQPLGPNGEDTTLIGQEFKDLKKFWDVDGSQVQLVNMKGSILSDEPTVAKVVRLLYGVDQATADQVAPIFMDWASQMPGGVDNPYFSFNLFAMNGTSIGQPYKIIVGDGVPDAFNALGLDPVGVRIAIGHEYGHIVQYKAGLTATTLTGPEASRRLELMADAEGTYFLVHARGEAFNAKRIATVARTMYDLGDCSFTSAGHHGTPLQRQRSVEWAADLANTARPQGPILTAEEFGPTFDAALPTLVAPDAS